MSRCPRGASRRARSELGQGLCSPPVSAGDRFHPEVPAPKVARLGQERWTAIRPEPFPPVSCCPLPWNSCPTVAAAGLPLWGQPWGRWGGRGRGSPHSLRGVPTPPGGVVPRGVPAVPAGLDGREAPHPLPTRAPTSPCLFIYLGKRPAARAGNGPVPGGRRGTRSHIVLPSRSAPAAAGAGTGICAGPAGRRRPGSRQPREGASVRGRGLCAGTTWMARGQAGCPDGAGPCVA